MSSLVEKLEAAVSLTLHGSDEPEKCGDLTCAQVLALSEAFTELQAACRAHGPMRSAHEGYGVLKEEFDELWDEIKAKKIDVAKMRKEAIQLTAMGLRFLVDVCDEAERVNQQKEFLLRARTSKL